MTSRKLAQEGGHLGLGPAVGRGGFGFGGVRESEGRGGGVWFGHRDKVTDVVCVGKLLRARVCRTRQVGNRPQPRPSRPPCDQILRHRAPSGLGGGEGGGQKDALRKAGIGYHEVVGDQTTPKELQLSRDLVNCRRNSRFFG